jgi:hypothetical protein
MIYAIDYDHTLTTSVMQQFVKKLIKQKNEVWIVTMRRDNDYNKKELEPVLNKLYLTEHNVIFCDEKPKWEMLKMINADVYIDNISDEFQVILNHTNTIPLLWQSL